MILNESNNAQFHLLIVSNEFSLQCIISFLEDIVRNVIQDVQSAMSRMSTDYLGGGSEAFEESYFDDNASIMKTGDYDGITPKEANWIRYHQELVQKNALKFCLNRSSYFNRARA